MKIFQPNDVINRITRQQGWFSIHPYVDDKVIPFGKEHLAKVIFKDELRDEILYKLNRLGINSYSVYPDLDGLAKYIEWKIFETNSVPELRKYEEEQRKMKYQENWKRK